MGSQLGLEQKLASPADVEVPPVVGREGGQNVSCLPARQELQRVHAGATSQPAQPQLIKLRIFHETFPILNQNHKLNNHYPTVIDRKCKIYNDVKQ